MKKKHSHLRLEQWTFSNISSDAQFNFYKDDFAVLKFY